MTVALNRRSGEREEVCYVDVSVWGRAAENCKRFLSKGSCVHVEGHLRLDQWEDRQTGKTRNKLRVVAESIQFINASEGGANHGRGPNLAESGHIAEDCAPPVAPPEPTAAEDDIPF